MGFWGTLGKIGLAAAPIAAAPFTGGASLAAMGSLSGILGMAGAAAPVIGGLAAGRAKGKQADYENESDRGVAMNNALLQEMNAKLLARKSDQEQRGGLLTDTIRGDIVNHLSDVVIPDNERVKVMHYGGGLRPSTMTANSREAGKFFSDNARQQLQDMSPTLAPELTENVADLPKAGMLDKILGVAGPVTAGMGAIGAVRGQQGTPPVAHPTPSQDPMWEGILADHMQKQALFGGQ